MTVVVATLASACAPDTLPSRPPNATKAPTPQQITLTRYACDHDALVQASYPTQDAAIVQYGGNTYEMRSARAADGARYVGTTLEWWTQGSGKGATAILRGHTDDGPGDVILECKAVSG